MKCPICGKAVPAGAERCTDCGYRCQTASNPSPTPGGGYTFPKRERTGGLARFGCCLGVLAVILLIVGLLGLSVTAFIEIADSGVVQREPEYPIESIAPDMDGTEGAEEADGSCFSIRNGAVTFREEAWDGGRVLRIPTQIDGETVSALAPGCFRNCDELTTIILPETLTKIDRSAFDGCTDLRGLFIPEGCTVIGADAFDGCVNMEAVYIPATMEAIASGTFDDCSGLRLLFYAGDFEDWRAIYDDYITPFTAAICLDGTYYHGTP